MPVGLNVHLTMAELLAGWPAARTAVARRGMACMGCPMAPFETLAEAADAYGIDARELLREAAGGRPSRSGWRKLAPPQRRKRRGG